MYNTVLYCRARICGRSQTQFLLVSAERRSVIGEKGGPALTGNICLTMYGILFHSTEILSLQSDIVQYFKRSTEDWTFWGDLCFELGDFYLLFFLLFDLMLRDVSALVGCVLPTPWRSELKPTALADCLGFTRACFPDELFWEVSCRIVFSHGFVLVDRGSCCYVVLWRFQIT